MEKNLNYQTALLTFLAEYAAFTPINFPNATIQVIADRENGHYQLVRFGWKENRYLYNTVFHFDLEGDQVIVRCNQTDLNIVEELELYGIEAEDVQVAFVKDEPPTISRLKQVEHLKGILSDMPYDKNDFYNQ
jgi:XisI protein